MDAKTLRNQQEKIDEWVSNIAKEQGFDSLKIMPIWDGVADEKAYLMAPMRIAWILKEPYDDWDENGRSSGGGWSIPKDLFLKEAIDWQHNPTWRTIAYIMNGYLLGKTWDTMPALKQKPEMINILRSIAWINISKMPARTSSSLSVCRQNFLRYWKDVVARQIEILDPEVIIFGNTFGCCQRLFGEAVKDETLPNNSQVWFWRSGKRMLLDAYHPGRKGKIYVDALIQALQVSKEQLQR